MVLYQMDRAAYTQDIEEPARSGRHDMILQPMDPTACSEGMSLTVADCNLHACRAAGAEGLSNCRRLKEDLWFRLINLGTMIAETNVSDIGQALAAGGLTEALRMPIELR